eukprot:3306448-Amphidinium_carterae.1
MGPELGAWLAGPDGGSASYLGRTKGLPLWLGLVCSLKAVFCESPCRAKRASTDPMVYRVERLCRNPKVVGSSPTVARQSSEL